MRKQQRQRGYVFVISIISMTVMLLIGTTFLAVSSYQFAQANNTLANLHATAMADAGVDYAVWRQKYTRTDDTNRDPGADVTPYNLTTYLPTELNLRTLSRGCGVSKVATIIPLADGQDQADFWIYKFIPDSAKPTQYGYQVISRGYYRRNNRGVRAVFLGDSETPPSGGLSPEDLMFSHGFYSDHGFNLGGACSVTGGMVVNGALGLNGGASIDGELAVNGSLSTSGGTTLAVSDKVRVKGDTLIDQGADIDGGLLTTGSLTMNGGGTLDGGAVVNGFAVLGGGAYNGGLKVIGNVTIGDGRRPTITGDAITNGSMSISGGGTFNNGMKVSKGLTVTSNGNPTVMGLTEIGGDVNLTSGLFNGGLKTLGNFTTTNNNPTIHGQAWINGNANPERGTYDDVNILKNLTITGWNKPTFSGTTKVNGTARLQSGNFSEGFYAVDPSAVTVLSTKSVSMPGGAQRLATPLLPTSISVPTLTPITLDIPTGVPEIDFTKYIQPSYKKTYSSLTIPTAWNDPDKTYTESSIRVNGNMSLSGRKLTTPNPISWYIGGDLTIGSSGGTVWTASDTTIYCKGNVTIDSSTIRGSGKFVIVAEGTITFRGSYDYGDTKFALLSHSGVNVYANGSLNANVYVHNTAKDVYFMNTGHITGSVITDWYNASGSGSVKCTYAPAPYPFLPPGDVSTGGLGATAWRITSWEFL